MNQKFSANPKIKPEYLASAYSLLIVIVVIGNWFSNKNLYWWLLLVIPVLYIPYILARQSKTQNPNCPGFTTNSILQYSIYQIISWILIIIPVLISPRLLQYTGLESREVNRRSHFALAIFFYFIAASALMINPWFSIGFFFIGHFFQQRSKKYS